jgi:hypothetical protein
MFHESQNMFHKYNYITYLCIMRIERKKTCSKCSNPLEDNRTKQRYCLSCHNKYMRDNRKKHSELTDNQRLKANCRSYLNTYLKRGKISKQPCKCGCETVEAHHDDYSKPLEVIWLCRKCHLELHVEH